MPQHKLHEAALCFDASISQFDGINPIPLQTTPTIAETIHYIKTDHRLKADIEEAREYLKAELQENVRDKKGKLILSEYENAKIHLPGVTWTGIFKKRNNNSLLSFSGFLSFDIDFIDKTSPQIVHYDDVRDKARAAYKILSHDQYTAFAFPSVSATGIKGLVKIPSVKTDPEYKAYFRAYKRYLREVCHQELDSLPDLSRLCFLSSYDNPYINRDSVLFTERFAGEEEEQPPQSNGGTCTDPSVQAAIKVLLRYGIQQELSRNDFVGLCAASKRAGIEYDTFDSIMQKTPGYDQKENFKIWNTAQPDTRENPMTVSSLIKFAREADKDLWREYRKEFSQAEDPDEEVEIGLASLIERKLSTRYEFSLNIVNDKIMVKTQEETRLMNDFLESEIRCWLLDHGFGKRDAISDVIRHVSFKHQFHPIKMYFSNLTWDKKDHFQEISRYFEEEDTQFPLFPYIFRAWCVGAVRRVFTGQHHQVLVFTGEQGKGKSFFAKWLCPFPEYYLDAPVNPETNDAKIRVSEKFIWEIGEMGRTTRKADIEALKQFISLEDPTFRRAHDKYDQKKRALASFIGTVNEDGAGFLNDPTGYRRWWPVRILNIDFAYADNIDVHQLWAQAVALFKQDATKWCAIPPAVQQKIDANIEKDFAMADPMEEALLQVFEFTGNDHDIYSTIDILVELERHGYKRDKPRADAMYLAKAIRTLQKEGHNVRKYREANFRGYQGLRPL